MSNILKINLRLYESLDPKLFNYLSSFESGAVRNEIIRRMLSQAIQNPETKLDPIEPVKTDTSTSESNQANNTSDEPVSNQKTDQTSLQTDLIPAIQYPESSPSKTHEDKQSKQQNEQNQPPINPSSNSSINQDFADSFVNIL